MGKSYPLLFHLLVSFVMKSYAESSNIFNHTIGTSKSFELANIAKRTVCNSDYAGEYACSKIDLEGFLPLSEMDGNLEGYRVNDIWGWTDRQTNKDYAIVGDRYGITFVDISNPEAPFTVGKLLAHDDKLTKYRDIKTYKNHAYIVAKTNLHGLQIFDLTILRLVTNTPVLFSETSHIEFLSSNVNRENTNITREGEYFLNGGYAENIFINKDSGFAYIVGTKFCTGLLIYDISRPRSPSYAGCFDKVENFFDAQCVNYDGPDNNYIGREICFASRSDRLTIIDVTAKRNTFVISQLTTNDFNAVYQGYLSNDKGQFLLGDQDDSKSLTHIIDLSNLRNPRILDTYKSAISSQVGYQTVNQNFLFHANHHAGLRVLDLTGVSRGVLFETAFFDLYTADNSNGLFGAIGVYPFFQSGIIAVTSFADGLFLLRIQLNESPSSKPSNKPSSQPSSKPTKSSMPSRRPSAKPSSIPSRQPSAKPSQKPSAQPSSMPSRQPSAKPSRQPSAQPSSKPSSKPSSRPSLKPTKSSIPSRQPSVKPSSIPSRQPSAKPSTRPSVKPSSTPSRQPSAKPSQKPSAQPSSKPSSKPSSRPSSKPTKSSMPSRQPSAKPSSTPSRQPSAKPSQKPSAQPSSKPSSKPSTKPSAKPSLSSKPSTNPSALPSGAPTISNRPSAAPSVMPSVYPTSRPNGPDTIPLWCALLRLIFGRF